MSDEKMDAVKAWGDIADALRARAERAEAEVARLQGMVEGARRVLDEVRPLLREWFDTTSTKDAMIRPEQPDGREGASLWSRTAAVAWNVDRARERLAAGSPGVAPEACDEKQAGVLRGLAVAAMILRDGQSYTMTEGADPLEWMARIIDARAKDGAVGSYLYRLSASAGGDPSAAEGARSAAGKEPSSEVASLKEALEGARKALEPVGYWDETHERCGHCLWTIAACDSREEKRRVDDPRSQPCRGFAGRRALARLTPAAPQLDPAPASPQGDGKEPDEERTTGEWQYLGDISAVPPDRSVPMECAECRVRWRGCADVHECPKCGRPQNWWKEVR